MSSTAPASEGEKILIVDDDARLRRLLERFLDEQGYRVRTVENTEQMDRLLSRELFQLVVLDLMMPGEDGLSACRRLREGNNQIPIIMLTAKGDEASRIQGLELGADDYLAKPFNPRELLARIRAVLRRSQATADPATSGARRLGFLGWRLDRLLREVRNPQGARVALTDAEFGLLQAFCDRPQRVLSRDQLLELTQGRTAAAFERSVDILVSRLRRKIESDPHDPSIIKTVRAGGYLFTPAVEPA